MSDIADGTYIIRNVANTALSINVKGATNGNGVNIWLYTVNKLHDGCYAYVQTCDDGNETSETFTADGGTDTFVISYATTGIHSVEKNSVVLEEDTDYTVSFNTVDNHYQVTFAETPANNDSIKITYAKSWRLITFPATGKAMSVAVGSGTGSGGLPGNSDNIYQWDIRNSGKGGGEQRWQFEDTGSTITFDGKSYNTYKIWLYVTLGGSPYTPKLVEYKGHGTPQSEGNVQIYADDGGSDQKWIFEPVESIFPGTYRIVTRTNKDYCLYVNGASKSAGAYIGVQPFTGGQNQTWYIPAQNQGRIQARPVHSFGDLATYATNTATNKDRCCQDGHGTNQTDHWWIPKPRPGKNVLIDGTTHQCYNLTIYAGNDLNLDLEGNNIKNWTWIYTENTSDAQLWAFVPVDVFDTTLPTPSGVGVLINGEEYTSGNIVWNSIDDIYPIWNCPGTKFQARYRVRVIGVSDSGTETYPNGWSDWMSVADGSTSYDGWGTEWLSNQTFPTPSDHKVGTVLTVEEEYFTADGVRDTFMINESTSKILTVKKNSTVLVEDTDYTVSLNSVYDLYEVIFTTTPSNGDEIEISYVKHALTAVNPACDIEIEVRYFTEEWSSYNLPAHGNSAHGSVRVYTPMTVAVSSVTRTGEGLVVEFTSDWATGGTTAKVSSLNTSTAKLMESVTESGKYAANDTIVVPWELIDQPISIGDTVNLSLDLTTSIGVAGTVSYSGTVLDGGDQGVTPTYEESDHATYTVTVPHVSGETTRMLFLQKGEKPIEITPYSKKNLSDKYDLLVPLNTNGEYLVIVSGFAVKPITLPKITSHFAVWTFGDGDWAVLDWGLNQNPTQEDSQVFDIDEYQLTGREFHAYRQRASRNREMTVSGAFVEWLPEHGSREALERLLKEGHAVYRNLRGQICKVFVSAINMPLKDTRFTEVTVTQYVETR